MNTERVQTSARYSKSTALRRVIEDCTLLAEHPSDISKGKLAEILNEHSFAIIQGIIQPSIVRAKEKLQDHFSAANDHPATGEAPEELLSNFQKLSIGGAASVYGPRCMRTFYNPLWAQIAMECARFLGRLLRPIMRSTAGI